jgi:VanZ family protein
MDAPAEAGTSRGALDFLRGLGRGLLRISRAASALPVLLWALLIWRLSSFPPRAAADHVSLRIFLANCGHAGEFGVLALLLALALPRTAAAGGAWPALETRGALLVLALVALYALIDELHQAATPGRDASLLDVTTDLCGAACVLWVAAYVGSPPASEAGLARRLAASLAACLVAGGAATFAPALVPGVGWL